MGESHTEPRVDPKASNGGFWAHFHYPQKSAGYLEIIRGLAMPHVSFVLFNLNNGMVPRTLLRLGESCHGTLLESEKCDSAGTGTKKSNKKRIKISSSWAPHKNSGHMWSALQCSCNASKLPLSNSNREIHAEQGRTNTP